MTAIDLTRDTVDSHLGRLRPDIIFFDFTEWVPGLARKHLVRSVYYATMFMLPVAYFLPRTRNLPGGCTLKEADLMHPSPGFPVHEIGLTAHEARALSRGINVKFGGEMTFLERTRTAFNESDVTGFKTCREMEAAFYEFVAKFVNKPVLLAGPMVPGVPGSRPDDDMDRWLKPEGDRSRYGSVLCPWK